MRFDLRKSFYRVQRQMLSYSPNSGFKYMGILTNREIDKLKGSGRFRSDTDQTVCQMIEGAPEVLDCVSNNQRNVSRNCLNTSEIVEAARRLSGNSAMVPLLVRFIEIIAALRVAVWHPGSGLV